MFPYRLKQLRENADLTQDELAKKLNLTQSTIAYYESGRKMPTLENTKAIAELFDTSLDYLLGLSENQNKETIEKTKEITSIADELSEEIHELSPESLKDLKKYIELLKIKDMQDKNTEFSDEISKQD